MSPAAAMRLRLQAEAKIPATDIPAEDDPELPAFYAHHFGKGRPPAPQNDDDDELDEDEIEAESAENNGAEALRDPFNDEAAANDSWRADLPAEAEVAAKPTSAFGPAKLRALAKLAQENPEAYLDLRNKLLEAANNPDVTKTKLDEAMVQAARQAKAEKKQAEEDGEEKETTIDALIRLGRYQTDLFHTADGVAHVTIKENGHAQTMRLRSRAFTDRLLFAFFQEKERGATADALNNAIITLEAIARHHGPERQVYPRIGFHEGKVYVDRGSDAFDAHEIAPAEKLPDGAWKPCWRLIQEAPVRFIRPEGVATGLLPVAVSGGSLSDLKPFLALRADEDFYLSIGFVLGQYHDAGEKPHLGLGGRPGSGKTMRERLLCSLADPLPPPPDKEKMAPGDPGSPFEDDWSLMLAAKTQLILTDDNRSEMSDGTADTYCRLSSGALKRRRDFYTLHSEVAIAAKRSIITTMTKALVLRDDLAERTLFPAHRPISKTDRRTVQALWSDYCERWPGFLGCIFSAVSVGLANSSVQLPQEKPRLADFALWVERCAPGLKWKRGAFLDALMANRNTGAEVVVDGNPVAAAIRDFMSALPKEPNPLPPVPKAAEHWRGWTDAGWRGTADALLKELKKVTDLDVRKDRKWPKGPSKLLGSFADAVNGLEQLGVAVETARSTHARTITLRWLPGHPIFSAPNTITRKVSSLASSNASATKNTQTGTADLPKTPDDAPDDDTPRAASSAAGVSSSAAGVSSSSGASSSVSSSAASSANSAKATAPDYEIIVAKGANDASDDTLGVIVSGGGKNILGSADPPSGPPSGHNPGSQKSGGRGRKEGRV